jgi:YD repeat-containing protein
MTATPATSSSQPTGTESIAGVQSLSRAHVGDAGRLTYLDEYHDLSGQTYSASSGTIGSVNTNYYRVEAGYDALGRMIRVKDASGTVMRTTFDALGRPTGRWIGTDDTGAADGDPDGSGGANNMLQVAAYEYDGGASNVGDGNLTKATLSPRGGATDRVSELYFDWRGRLVASKSGVQGGSEAMTPDVQRMITYSEYDNLGNAIALETYDGDAQTITRIQEEGGADSDGVPNRPSSSLMRSKLANSFDEQGRVYRSLVYNVDQSTGSPGNLLQSDLWYDRRGNVIKTKEPTGSVSKANYDGPGRVLQVFASDGGGDPAPAAMAEATPRPAPRAIGTRRTTSVATRSRSRPRCCTTRART